MPEMVAKKAFRYLNVFLQPLIPAFKISERTIEKRYKMLLLKHFLP